MGLRDWFIKFKSTVASGRGRSSGRDSVMEFRRGRLLSWLRGDYTLQNSELLFSAISRISNSLSAMPVRLYKGTEPADNNVGELVGFSPNPNMTSSQFFKTMEACRCTYGNAYAMKRYDENLRTTRVDVLDPARVTPLMNEDNQELYYRISTEGGNETIVHNYHVLHIPFMSTNGYTGVNPVSVLFNTLEYSQKIQQFSVEQLERGLNVAAVIETPASLSDRQKKSAVSSLQETYRETGGNVLFLESGLQAKALNLSPVDTKLFEVEKITRGKVAMVYGIPAHMLGDYSDTSFTSQEHQMLEYLTLTMLPIVTAYEQELARKLLTAEERVAGYHFKFNMDAILRADSASMADVNQKALRGGWKTPNEVRYSYGDPHMPHGDELMISRDLLPLRFIVENPGAMVGFDENVKEGDDNGDDTKNGSDNQSGAA